MFYVVSFQLPWPRIDRAADHKVNRENHEKKGINKKCGCHSHPWYQVWLRIRYRLPPNMTSSLVCVSLGVRPLHCHLVRDSAFDRGGERSRQSECAMTRPALSPRLGVEILYFFVRLLVDVILLVVIRSPMYFCRNLLLLSSLSCSSRTASMRLNMVTRDS